MVRPLHKLSALKVASLKEVGRHSDGGGLYLHISDGSRRRWIFLFRQDGKQREKGLGSARDVSLAKAREKAEAIRKELREGVDPFAVVVPEGEVPTFGKFADDLVGDLASGFRNEKHIEQWKMTLGDAYCSKLRRKLVSEIASTDVLDVLKPIWSTKQETASRIRGRIERVLDAARARGLRTGENPARWKGHLDALLPKRHKLARGHHAAMPYSEVGATLSRLQGLSSASARALQLVILAAARSGEVLGMRWGEVDLPAGVWTVPADRMKAGREHRVPLTKGMLAILDELALLRPEGDEVGRAFVFPGNKPGKGLSVMSLTMCMRRLKLGHYTVHGFRSAFRDWVSEETDFSRELAEAALAHVYGDETERAYRRGDALKKRLGLMETWESYLARVAPPVL